MSNEFDIIKKYFSEFPQRSDVILGVGDDAAILQPPKGHDLVITTDTLISGVHFPEQTSAESIGHKSLAVNLSDLAAMGAKPLWFTLALTLPEADSEWLSDFSQGLKNLAARYQVALVGGDTTRGPLSITIQACGSVPEGRAVRRSGASPGDDIYVTGTLGDAGFGLASVQGKIKLSDADRIFCERKLNHPEPRVSAGMGLLTLATAMIDCSDGFAADLGHMLEQSKNGAEVQIKKLPLSTPVKNALEKQNDYSFPLAAGDDFELIFTASPESRNEITALEDVLDCSITWVGKITQKLGLLLREKSGELYNLKKTGYQHFE